MWSLSLSCANGSWCTVPASDYPPSPPNSPSSCARRRLTSSATTSSRQRWDTRSVTSSCRSEANPDIVDQPGSVEARGNHDHQIAVARVRRLQSTGATNRSTVDGGTGLRQRLSGARLTPGKIPIATLQGLRQGSQLAEDQRRHRPLLGGEIRVAGT